MVSDRIVVGIEDDEGLDLVSGGQRANLAGPGAGVQTRRDASTRAGCSMRRQIGLGCLVFILHIRLIDWLGGIGQAFESIVGCFEVCGHDFLLNLKKRLHRLLKREHCVFRGGTKLVAQTGKVITATYQDGFLAQGSCSFAGPTRWPKPAGPPRPCSPGSSRAVFRCGRRWSNVWCGACRPQGVDPAWASQVRETVLRIAVADNSFAAVERFATN